jgi:hypothetical protein
MASERGKKLGEAFGKLSTRPVTADDVVKVQSFQDAIARGRHEAAEQAWNMDELAGDEDHLREMGFGGRADGIDG